MGRRQHLKLSLNVAAGPPPRPDVRGELKTKQPGGEELRKSAVFTWFNPSALENPETRNKKVIQNKSLIRQGSSVNQSQAD